MKKGIVSATMALIFALGVVGTGMASVKCTVTAVDTEKNTVIMTCKDADKLKVDDKVRVKKVKKAGAVEGC